MVRCPRGQGQEIAGVHRYDDGADLAREGEDRGIRRLSPERGNRQGALRRMTVPVRDADEGFRAALVKEKVQRGAPSGAAGPGGG